jgi:hypothetical protein
VASFHGAWLRHLPPHRIRRYRSRSDRHGAARTRRHRYFRIALAALALAAAPLAQAHPDAPGACAIGPGGAGTNGDGFSMR